MLPGAVLIGSTLSKLPGRRWVVVRWADSRESCVLAALPLQPTAAYRTTRGDESRLIQARDLERAVEAGVLVPARDGVGGAALSLVARTLLDDGATPAPVRELLRRTSP